MIATREFAESLGCILCLPQQKHFKKQHYQPGRDVQYDCYTQPLFFFFFLFPPDKTLRAEAQRYILCDSTIYWACAGLKTNTVINVYGSLCEMSEFTIPGGLEFLRFIFFAIFVDVSKARNLAIVLDTTHTAIEL